MKFNFSYKITLIGFLLMLIFCRLSYWQYTRHEEKKGYIAQMKERLEKEVEDIDLFLKDDSTNWENLTYRKLAVSGEYDFSKEIILRNRRLEGVPGVHVVTPMKLDNSIKYVLVNRGFIPLDKSTKEQREVFIKEKKTSFVGLVKESQKRKVLSPKDPEIKAGTWVDAWLRINIAKIQKQLPYELLPVSLEIVEDADRKNLSEEIVQSKSGKSELLSLPLRGIASANKNSLPKDLNAYPIAVLNTVIPPGRHFGYIFEWLFIALLTFFICVVLQIRRN